MFDIIADFNVTLMQSGLRCHLETILALGSTLYINDDIDTRGTTQ